MKTIDASAPLPEYLQAAITALIVAAQDDVPWPGHAKAAEKRVALVAAIRAYLAEGLVAAEAERDEAQRQLSEERTEVELKSAALRGASQRLDVLAAERDRLREALDRYGCHRMSCDTTVGGACTCGFRLALAPDTLEENIAKYGPLVPECDGASDSGRAAPDAAKGPSGA